jgi:hypothetical protein
MGHSSRNGARNGWSSIIGHYGINAIAVVCDRYVITFDAAPSLSEIEWKYNGIIGFGDPRTREATLLVRRRIHDDENGWDEQDYQATCHHRPMRPAPNPTAGESLSPLGYNVSHLGKIDSPRDCKESCKTKHAKMRAHLTPLPFTEYLSRFWLQDVQNRLASLVKADGRVWGGLDTEKAQILKKYSNILWRLPHLRPS